MLPWLPAGAVIIAAAFLRLYMKPRWPRSAQPALLHRGSCHFHLAASAYAAQWRRHLYSRSCCHEAALSALGILSCTLLVPLGNVAGKSKSSSASSVAGGNSSGGRASSQLGPAVSSKPSRSPRSPNHRNNDHFADHVYNSSRARPADY